MSGDSELSSICDLLREARDCAQAASLDPTVPEATRHYRRELAVRLAEELGSPADPWRALFNLPGPPAAPEMFSTASMKANEASAPAAPHPGALRVFPPKVDLDALEADITEAVTRVLASGPPPGPRVKIDRSRPPADGIRFAVTSWPDPFPEWQRARDAELTAAFDGLRALAVVGAAARYAIVSARAADLARAETLRYLNAPAVTHPPACDGCGGPMEYRMAPCAHCGPNDHMQWLCLADCRARAAAPPEPVARPLDRRLPGRLV